MSGILVPKPMLGRQLRKGPRSARGLVGYWLSNEGCGGQVFDLSGNGKNFILYNNPLWVTGKFGSAVGYNGSTQYGKIVTANNPLRGLTAITVLMWFNTTDTTALTRLMSNGTFDDFDFGPNFSGATVGGVANNHLGWFIRDTGGWFDVGEITSGEWTQIVLTADSTQLKGYINGVNTYTNITPWTNSVDGDLTLAARFDTTGNTDSQIDHVLIYNRVLTARKIAESYLRPFAMFDRTPIELWVGATSVGVAPVGQPTMRRWANIPHMSYLGRRSA